MPITHLPQRDLPASNTASLESSAGEEDWDERNVGIPQVSSSATECERSLQAKPFSVRIFHPYLYGRCFKARTDHNSLRWLKNFREPEGQVARWLEILAEFDFDILHRARETTWKC